VAFTDSLGTIHIRWDCARQVGIIAEDTRLIRVVPAQSGSGTGTASQEAGYDRPV
jgi:hypothetical protein